MGALFEPFFYIIGLVVSLYFKIVVVEIVLHWLIHFKILEPTNKYAKKTMELLEKATHPVYDKINNRTNGEKSLSAGLTFLRLFCY